MTNQVKPLVSVKTITYNHYPFIKQCIEGILMQRTTFPFEYVIGEDCSTDGTHEIVLEYGQKYPEIIRVITSESNVGAFENSRRTNLACQGKYIALCEGDDFWTDPDKLQKQVDFLEEHPEYALCLHNTMIEYEDGSPKHIRHVEIWDTCSLEDLILNFNDFTPNVTAGHTSSMVFRNGLIKTFPAWFSKSMSGDLPLQILLAQYGKAKFINEVMSVHRKHPGGISRTHEGIPLLENRIMMYKGLKETLDKKYGKTLDQVLVLYFNDTGDYYLDHHSFLKAYSSYSQAFGGAIAVGKIIRYIPAHLNISTSLHLTSRARSMLHRMRQFWRGAR